VVNRSISAMIRESLMISGLVPTMVIILIIETSAIIFYRQYM